MEIITLVGIIIGIIVGVIAILEKTFRFLPRKKKTVLRTKIKKLPYKVESIIGKQGRELGDFLNVRGITIDSDNYIYVSDGWNHKIKIFDSNLIFIKAWGKKGKKKGELDTPTGLAFDSQGFLYVIDRYNIESKNLTKMVISNYHLGIRIMMIF